MYANVIVDITHEKLDKVFQYSIPTDLTDKLKVGMEVVIPFGRGNRETKGYIVALTDVCNYDSSKIKEILRVQQKSIGMEAKFVALAAWMKEYYGGTMIQALKTVLPIKQQEKERKRRSIRCLLTEEEGQKKLSYYLDKNQKARARLMAELLDHEILDYDLVTRKLNITGTVITALENQQVLEVDTERIYRNPIKDKVQDMVPVPYTLEQTQAIETFWEDYKNGRRHTYLVHGVTGSGKTEVYIEMIARVIQLGRQAIVLIPEIALTYQTVLRFYKRFGERVSIMNSRLSKGERYDQMERAKLGEIDVMIGPRSALFTPFQNLGLIVIDEEHESTYKSEQIPRYHTRETAEKRAEIEDASVVLGSATPSVEAYYRAKTGDYVLLELLNRVQMQDMAKVEIVDLREELKEGNRSILSIRLKEYMTTCLENHQQMMLFINRRGYAGFISCRSCGYVVKCPHCDVSLSSHKNGKLVCHYCGYEEPHITKCPSCGSKHVGGFRAGTQQIEVIVKELFPTARVLRMDMDTTKEKDGHEKILAAFANEEADILIGTQMIVKGHDFPNVTLVGVLAADLSLYTDDYRAGERTFQLLTQAAGRAGRSDKKGKVVIQTYSPEHYSIVTAANQDYQSFYKEEIGYRSIMGYPPVEQLLAVLISGEEEELLEKASRYLKEYAFKYNRKETMQIIGPASPYIGRVKDIYRKVIYIKDQDYQCLVDVKNKLEQYMEVNSGFHKIRVQFDFNPMNIF
ncbi:MAG: primosomal protein N' [Lachnospiraceae bacterium]